VLAATLAIGAAMTGAAQAAPAGLPGVGSAADELNVIDRAQYIYGGRRYCFYVSGWQGPGWYRCGYALRRGFGWGGGEGWRGWDRAGPRPYRGRYRRNY
jgi:hypothetical protein